KPIESKYGNDAFIHKFHFDISPVRATVVSGHILRLTGDNLASFVSYTDVGDGKIRLIVDHEAERIFTGIDSVDAQMLGGPDTFVVKLIPEVSSPSALTGTVRFAALSLQTGSGDDTVDISAAIGPQYLVPDAWSLSLDTGGDNDSVTGDFEGSIPLKAI